MRIIEIFHSLQGEGPATGLRTSFIRTARCNLRCVWCDTPYSFGPGVERSLESILEEVRRHGTHHACLTGGEPLLQPESVPLLQLLSAHGWTTVVETGGSLDVTPYLENDAVVLSVDVKCPASRMSEHNRWANLPMLRPRDIVKFVIQDAEDYEYAKRTMADHPYRAGTVFQPVWGTDARALAERVIADRLDVRVMLQTHKQLWGDAPGH